MAFPLISFIPPSTADQGLGWRINYSIEKHIHLQWSREAAAEWNKLN